MFIHLTQPQGERQLINLDQVVRIWPAREGGIVLCFTNLDSEGNNRTMVYQEAFSKVCGLLEENSLVLS